MLCDYSVSWKQPAAAADSSCNLALLAPSANRVLVFTALSQELWIAGRRRFSGAGPELEPGERNTKHGGEKTKQGAERGRQEEKRESDRARGKTRVSERRSYKRWPAKLGVLCRCACSMFVCVSEANTVSLASYCSSSCVQCAAQVFTARHARVPQDITLLWCAEYLFIATFDKLRQKPGICINDSCVALRNGRGNKAHHRVMTTLIHRWIND